VGNDLFFHELLLLGLPWLYVVLYWAWPWQRGSADQAGGQPAKRPKRYAKTPKPFAGLTQKPLCSTCEQAVEPHPPPCRAAPIDRLYTGRSACGGFPAPFLSQSAL